MNTNSSTPLFIDLDGTLIKSDMLIESVFTLLKQKPAYILSLPGWLLKGKAYLKHQIASRIDFDPALLPYNESLLDYLKVEAGKNREIILATASNEKLAKRIATFTGLFTDTIASDQNINLSGKRKLSRIQDYTQNTEFAYAGNSKKDMPVWQEAAEVIIVNPEAGVENQAKNLGKPSQVFTETPSSIKSYLKAMRIHQWAKNVLLFLPILAAHKINEPNLMLDALIAFFAFGLCASSVYLLNDMLDLPSDRTHHTKKFRPLAAGTINTVHATLMIPILLLFSFSLTAFLPVAFLIVLSGYYITTVLYSFFLKKQVIVDVLLLASLYTVRVVAGSAATGIFPSFWLLAFSMFIFLSLAIVKRCAELYTLRQSNDNKAKGRGYQSTDMEFLYSMGTSSGYIAVLVIALYINSEKVLTFYSQPIILWLLCPLLLYWISRVWLKTGRGEMNEDPVVFAFRDWQSRLIALVAAVIFTLANLF